MGACCSRKQDLSENIKKELIEIFKKIDVDNSNTIDKQETINYW